MRISEGERQAVIAAIEAGKLYGFGNLIAHLQTAWARRLVENDGFDEATARSATTRDGAGCYSLAMQDDLLKNGEWDETGERYRKSK